MIQQQKTALFLALLMSVLALLSVAFAYQWQWLWAYKVLAFPGHLVLGLFSEEIDFWPKLALLTVSQFASIYLSAIFLWPLGKKLFTKLQTIIHK